MNQIIKRAERWEMMQTAETQSESCWALFRRVANWLAHAQARASISECRSH